MELNELSKYYKYKRWPEDKPENKTERDRVLDILLSSRMRISTLSQLNDPFEGNLLAIKNPAKVAEEPDAPEFLQALVRLDDDWRATIARYKVLCLSGQPDIPLMWSHYADSHKGLCFAVTLSSHSAEPVQYLPTTERISEFIGEPHDTKNALLAKYQYWDHEKEHRVICDSEWPDDYVPITAVELILGWRMSQPEREFWYRTGQEMGLRVSRAIVTGSPRIDRTRSKALILCD
jgi:hypothetical protein